MKTKTRLLLTKEGRILLKKHIRCWYDYLNWIEEHIEPGSGKWTTAKRYIEGLEFLLDVENSYDEIIEKEAR